MSESLEDWIARQQANGRQDIHTYEIQPRKRHISKREIPTFVWVAVDEDGAEVMTTHPRGLVRFDPDNIEQSIPHSIREEEAPCRIWIDNMSPDEIGRFGKVPKLHYLPKGSIKKLTGKEMTWKDEPIKIEES